MEAAEREYDTLDAALKKFQDAFVRRIGRKPKRKSEVSDEYNAADKRRRELEAEFPGLVGRPKGRAQAQPA